MKGSKKLAKEPPQELDEDEKLLRLREEYEETSCRFCDEYCPRDHKFCQECGAENNRFDEKEFVKEWGVGKTLATIKTEECGEGHPLFSDLEEDLRPKFCPICGKRILLQ